MVSLKRPGHPGAGLLIGSLGAALIAGAAGRAGAATATGTIMVSTTVAATCTVSTNPLTFGLYQPGQGSMNASTTFAVRCTRGASFNIALNAGVSGGSVAQRMMSMGAGRLQYNLYTTAARTVVWGDGTLSSATVSGVGRGLMNTGAIVQTVYGLLPDSPANVNLAPGLYTDIVTVTVSY